MYGYVGEFGEGVRERRSKMGGVHVYITPLKDEPFMKDVYFEPKN